MAGWVGAARRPVGTDPPPSPPRPQHSHFQDDDLILGCLPHLAPVPLQELLAGVQLARRLLLRPEDFAELLPARNQQGISKVLGKRRMGRRGGKKKPLPPYRATWAPGASCRTALVPAQSSRPDGCCRTINTELHSSMPPHYCNAAIGKAGGEKTSPEPLPPPPPEQPVLLSGGAPGSRDFEELLQSQQIFGREEGGLTAGARLRRAAAAANLSTSSNSVLRADGKALLESALDAGNAPRPRKAPRSPSGAGWGSPWALPGLGRDALTF